MQPGYKEININTGIHFTFTTLPDGQEKFFQDQVDEDYFSGFSQNDSSIRPYLYKPLKFYLLGDYDMCYITFINNFKFSHRLFTPRTKNNVAFKPHAFQSYSGFVLTPEKEILSMQSQIAEKYFVGVINLKLNNGLLIGNGLEFIEYAYNKLVEILDNIPFIISQTFAWFEISLTVFFDNPSELSNILKHIRGLEIGDASEKLISQSLFSSFEDVSQDNIKQFSLFSDLHSIIGFNHKLVEDKLVSEYVSGFLNFAQSADFGIETEIEWLVKPGHEGKLIEFLKKDKYLNNGFDFKSPKYALGKFDLIIKQTDNNLITNLHLIRNIYKGEVSTLFKHIRRVRTKVFLNSHIDDKPERDYFTWDKTLTKLAYKQVSLTSMERKLKALKISRQVRLKIAKIFINYNNGIQDPIQFPYFLDFTVFTKKLRDLIFLEFRNNRNGTSQIKELETKLIEHIKIFQEGYNVRFLNGYQFENISDFNLDFNSSIPQLLTNYNTLIYEYGKLFYKNQETGQVIQLNNKDTESNYRSINYSIHHLTSPEFVFSTISKEILNALKVDFPAYFTILEEIKNSTAEFLEKANESYLDDLIEHNLFDVDYFVIDTIRFIVTYQMNFDLFYYWFWTYDYQNPTLFETGGMLNEDFLRLEMLRIIMIKEFFKIDDAKLENPSPELFTYWDRHYQKINSISNIIITYLENFEIRKVINDLIMEFFKRLWKAGTQKQKFNFYNETIDQIYVDEDFRKNTFQVLLQDAQDEFTMKSMIKFVFQVLVEHYEKNNKRINLLRRDWQNGKVLENHISLYEDAFYAIDQTGGIFFFNGGKMDEYFEQNARNLLVLTNFALIQKKDFFLERITKGKTWIHA